MATKGRNVRKRIYTNSKGNNVYKSQKHMGSPYHSQDKKTGQIRSQGKKATEARLKPTTTSGGKPSGSKLPVKKTSAVGKAKSLPSKNVRGRNKTVKNMGRVKPVSPKQLAKTASTAKKLSKATGIGALAVGATMLAVEAASDKNLYGNRLNRTETRKMTPPKSKPMLSEKGNKKAVKAINPKAGSKAGTVVKKTPAKTPKVTTPKRKAPAKTATSNYERQVTKGTIATRKRQKTQPSVPQQKPRKTNYSKPKKSSVDKQVSFILDYEG